MNPILLLGAVLGIAHTLRQWKRDQEEEPIRQARIRAAQAKLATQRAEPIGELDYDELL